MRRPRRRSSRLFGALLLLALLAALLPLSSYLAGILPGGGQAPDPGRATLRPQAAAPLQITVVRAEDAAPVEGARILVRGLAGGEAMLTSDAKGKASLLGAAHGPVEVRAQAGDAQATAWADPRLEPVVRLAVARPAERSGRLQTPAGEPLRARVRLLDAGGATLAETETDAQGRYRLPEDERAVAVAAFPEKGPPVVSRRGDLMVAGGSHVAGRIAGASGGTLQVIALVPTGEDGLQPLRLEWTVGPDGAFRGELPEGARAFATYKGLPLRLTAGELQLPERAVATGRVLRADGTPAPRARLLFRPLLDGGFAAPLPGLRVETDEEGRFEAPGFARVAYAVKIRAEGCATEIFPEVTLDTPLELRVKPGYRVAGFVVDTAGLPVRGAALKAMSLPDPEGRYPVARRTADDQGRFLFEGLGGEHARIRIEAPGHYPTTLPRVRATDGLRIVLQPKR